MCRIWKIKAWSGCQGMWNLRCSLSDWPEQIIATGFKNQVTLSYLLPATIYPTICCVNKKMYE